jgi:hypothetical protein
MPYKWMDVTSARSASCGPFVCGRQGIEVVASVDRNTFRAAQCWENTVMLRTKIGTSLRLIAAWFTGVGLCMGAYAQESAPVASTGATHAAPLERAAAAAEAHNWHMRDGELLKRTWGIEVLGVRLATSGWMLTFRYKVLDPDKAKVLLDPKSTAYLVDESSGARLAVPAMENIGELRQTKDMGYGREYFIMFGNGNRVVRRGAKVDVVIGNFHADGVTVE